MIGYVGFSAYRSELYYACAFPWYEFDFGMTIDARYNFGLSNVYDEEGSPNNTMFMLSLGYKFDL